ncbi:MAG: hypothetical protein HDR03_16330 [Lachnospiraceae bacterium]|nr:hypothetical protein [Lachnospiraceae bacterium]
MQKFIKNICKLGIFLMVPMFVLTACTGKEDIVLELGETQDMSSQNMRDFETESTSDGDWNQSDTGENAASEANTAADSNAALDVSIDAVPEQIYVHICGAVVNPGVYELEAGSRVFEGINAAGGFSETACEDYVNQAGQLSDGERLVIPTVEEVEQAKEDGTYQVLWAAGTADKVTLDTGEDKTGSSGNSDGLVNINTATESELGNVNGIGAGKAAAIVQYRQENGNFASTEDIMKVSGIKEGTYEKIKDKITVN